MSQPLDIPSDLPLDNQREADPETDLSTMPLEEAVLEPFEPRFPSNILEVQIALARIGFSSGSLDGVLGGQTRQSIEAFQRSRGLLPTGRLNAPTQLRLRLTHPPFQRIAVQQADLNRLAPVPKTWMEKSEVNRLEFETLLEWAAEKGGAHPNLIRQLNPDCDWSNIPAGTLIKIPDITLSAVPRQAARIVIRLHAKTLNALDAQGKVIAHFPCSIARRVEKRPLGTLRIVNVAENPNYSFNPENFPESPEARRVDRVLIIPPGPNNPVGSAWMGLDKPGYGIHGTPSPEAVGRTESLGCIRLANWNAETLLKLAWVGMPVEFLP